MKSLFFLTALIALGLMFYFGMQVTLKDIQEAKAEPAEMVVFKVDVE